MLSAALLLACSLPYTSSSDDSPATAPQLEHDVVVALYSGDQKSSLAAIEAYRSHLTAQMAEVTLTEGLQAIFELKEEPSSLYGLMSLWLDSFGHVDAFYRVSQRSPAQLDFWGRCGPDGSVVRFLQGRAGRRGAAAGGGGSAGGHGGDRAGGAVAGARRLRGGGGGRAGISTALSGLARGGGARFPAIPPPFLLHFTPVYLYFTPFKTPFDSNLPPFYSILTPLWLLLNFPLNGQVAEVRAQRQRLSDALEAEERSKSTVIYRSNRRFFP